VVLVGFPLLPVEELVIETVKTPLAGNVVLPPMAFVLGLESRHVGPVVDVPKRVQVLVPPKLKVVLIACPAPTMLSPKRLRPELAGTTAGGGPNPPEVVEMNQDTGGESWYNLLNAIPMGPFPTVTAVLLHPLPTVVRLHVLLRALSKLANSIGAVPVVSVM
jgi:hypothetical protein